MLNIPENLKQLTQRKFEFILQDMDIDNNKWKSEGTEKNRLKLWMQNDDTYLVRRSEIDIKLSVDTVKNLISDIELRMQYDNMVRKIDEIKTIGGHMKVIGSVVKGSWPVADRTFCVNVLGFWNEHGDWCLISFDTDKNEYKEKGVEATMYAMCWFCSPISENETRVTYYVKSDPKVKGVPKSLLNRLTKDSAMLPLVFAEYVEKNFKK